MTQKLSPEAQDLFRRSAKALTSCGGAYFPGRLEGSGILRTEGENLSSIPGYDELFEGGYVDRNGTFTRKADELLSKIELE